MLRPSKEYADSFTAEDFGFVLGVPDNCPMLSLPLSVRRIIKIENFYLIFYVKDFRLAHGQNNSLDSIKIDFEFTNKY